MEVGTIKRLYKNKDNLAALSLFSLFLALYLFLFYFKIIRGQVDTDCISDECRYIQYAKNILNGFYSPPPPDVDLVSGPGFPLFLAPFQLLGIQRKGIIIINIILSSTTVCILFLLSRFFINYRLSILLSSAWGFYYIHYNSIFSAETEVFASLLFVSSFYFYTLYTIKNNKIFLILSGFSFGWLVLTKVIFSYVLLFILIFSILLSILRKEFLSFLIFSLLAFSFTFPYQLYTFKLTNIPFYFSTQGGEQLYWMSTPYEGEFGEWQNDNFDANCNFITQEVPCNKTLYERNHGFFFKKLANLNQVDRDILMKKQAFKNIKKKPFKYIKNISSNISRMFFNIPNSYFYQRDITTSARIFPNSILFTLILLSFALTITNFSNTPKSIQLFFLLTFIYLLLSSLVSAYPRMLNITLPVILPWVANTLFIWKHKSK